MPNRPIPDRETQISLMVNAPERSDKHVQNWLADPEIKATLHRYDNKNNSEHRKVKRVANH